MERSGTDSGSLSELAWRDDLTGAWNRRFLRKLLTERWPQLVAAHGSMTLLVLDLDGFKPINDTYGHLAGDRVLRWAADELRRGFRDEDHLIRYGGDEFVVALSDVGVSEARSLAERARSDFGSVKLVDPRSGETREVPISFSIGVASYPEDGATGDEILAIADKRLYEEKRRRTGPPPDPARGRRRLVAAALLSLSAALVAGWFVVRSAREKPPLPESILDAGGAASAEASGYLPAPLPDEAELQSLRDEVGRLRAALAEARATDERASFEARIVELEARLAASTTAAAQATEARSAGAPSDREASSGLRIGERRQREGLVPAPESQAPPVPVPVGGPPAGATASTVGAPGESVIVAPRLVRAPRPTYPRIARMRRRQGTVELEVTISPQGRVVAAVPLGPAAGLGMDEAAREAALSARYEPGTRNGIAEQMTTTLVIRFQLEGPPS